MAGEKKYFTHLSEGQATACRRACCPGLIRDAWNGPYCVPSTDPTLAEDLAKNRLIPQNCLNDLQKPQT